LQRIDSGVDRMHIVEQSVRGKIDREVHGWIQTLLAIGFTRQTSTSDDECSMILSPNCEYKTMLTMASGIFQAMLG
jgi:hypothetical protein